MLASPRAWLTWGAGPAGQRLRARTVGGHKAGLAGWLADWPKVAVGWLVG
jgi:hypothetical protein